MKLTVISLSAFLCKVHKSSSTLRFTKLTTILMPQRGKLINWRLEKFFHDSCMLKRCQLYGFKQDDSRTAHSLLNNPSPYKFHLFNRFHADVLSVYFQSNVQFLLLKSQDYFIFSSPKKKKKKKKNLEGIFVQIYRYNKFKILENMSLCLCPWYDMLQLRHIKVFIFANITLLKI